MGGLERRVEELEARAAALERMAFERAELEELEAPGRWSARRRMWRRS